MTRVSRVVVPSILLMMSACVTGVDTPDGEAVVGRAPALGKADGTDTADRSCEVVLRSVGRVAVATDGETAYETRCDDGPCRYVFRAVVEVVESVPEDAAVYVLYRSGGDPWRVQMAHPSADTPGPGFRRYDALVTRGLFGPDTEDMHAPDIELVAFLHMADGSRRFDHNRFARATENHVLSSDNGFGSWDGGACPPEVGTVSFHEGWSEWSHGALRQGGYLGLHYDIDRLPRCRGTHNGYPAWDVVAHARFLPGGQSAQGSVRRLITDNGTPTNEAVDEPFITRIPDDAESVQIWFHNYSGAGSSCSMWDSRYGRNYVYEIWPPEDHPRCRDMERETGVRSEDIRMVHNDPTCLSYDVEDQASARDCELWVDGFGLGHMAHYGIPNDWLVAYLRLGSFEGTALGVGMYSRFRDRATGETGQRFSYGEEMEPGLYKAGFSHHVTGFMSTEGRDYEVEEYAFFVDVQRPSGQVDRLWESQRRANYSWHDAFGPPTSVQYIPYGNIEWAGDDSAVLASRRTCSR